MIDGMSRAATFLRSLLRFRLRTLLLAVLVICVALGIYVNRVRQQQAAVAAIRQVGGGVYYDYQCYDGNLDVDRKSNVPDWLRTRLGDDWFHSVVNVNVIYRNDAKGTSELAPANDEFLAALEDLPRLEALVTLYGPASDDGLRMISRARGLKSITMLYASRVTDRGVEYLAQLKVLESLKLNDSQITDESLRILSQLPRLKELDVQGSRVTNDGLKHISRMHQLESLWVCSLEGKCNLAISDDGLVHLRELSQLQVLGLQGTGVTDAGFDQLAGLTSLRELFVANALVRDQARLQSALPNCVIHGVASGP
jgi:hypothetical protein